MKVFLSILLIVLTLELLVNATLISPAQAVGAVVAGVLAWIFLEILR